MKQRSLSETLRLLRQGGIESVNNRHLQPLQMVEAEIPIEQISHRISLMISFFKKSVHQNPFDMYCFIMYDITDNRIRNYISKYLLKQGCQRIQKSVFMASLKRENFREIHETLKEVNDLYANEDSIIFVPVGEYHLQDMKVVGKNVDFQLVINTPNTLFF
jgi:CRISPR-associated endonuclease Cas2